MSRPEAIPGVGTAALNRYRTSLKILFSGTFRQTMLVTTLRARNFFARPQIVLVYFKYETAG